MSRPTAKVLSKFLKEDTKIQLRKQDHKAIREKVVGRLNGFRKVGNQSYRAVARRIGAVTFFKVRLNVNKLPARRIGRSRETQTKEFDQAMSEFGSTIFENNNRDSIRTVSHPRIKARESLENVIIKNFNFRDEVVRGWRSRRNMPSII